MNRAAVPVIHRKPQQNINFFGVLSLLLLLFTLLAANAYAKPAKTALTLAVLDFRGADVARARWQPLADFIATTLQTEVTLVPLQHTELLALAGQTDLLLSNPVVTSQLLKYQPNYQVVATLNSQAYGDAFAGDIIVHRDSPLHSMAQLQGRVIGVVNQSTSAGGFLFQAYELVKLGWQPLSNYVQFATLNNQYAILQRVANKQVDAGFVRSGLIADAKEYDPTLFRVLPPANPADSPHTTPKYPHWGVVVSDSLTAQQISQVKMALLSLSASSPVATAAGIKGFVAAADYQAITELLNQIQPALEK
ncbi:phosphate/phosphite/phosphonate ABC transporter substrate-binding protein [Corallincola holothuriorum]|uniref:Phosphate/phosphite/phosphonate ABC transporter substrate-binding protein n=1 Tax=Corallincola holothuriorum TaxID=2282215 RepID=A0A368N4K4_9GAMM|nr:phosphate/phosphite/phosphonate ABC transporter substrate-binding protein [Corallincola holothuriorum]RCU45462.1 phosphate/phosphite/phosphonate ABC transporter substrate-binding protein [Corallincola holothuriorum]